MLDKLKNIFGKATAAISSTVTLVGDLNGDGKVDSEDAKVATEWAKNTASAAGDEAVKLGKQALKSDMVKDAVSGAAVGAVVAVPIPFVGPVIGATFGAGVGVYKNLTNNSPAVAQSNAQVGASRDVYVELLKLDDLKQKGIVTAAEFESQKKRLLSDN
jgi:hypothetical protein